MVFPNLFAFVIWALTLILCKQLNKRKQKFKFTAHFLKGRLTCALFLQPWIPGSICRTSYHKRKRHYVATVEAGIEEIGG